MRHLDLFSGIGGFALAAQRAGCSTVAFVEIDRACQRVLRTHWPDVPIWSDASTYSPQATPASPTQLPLEAATGPSLTSGPKLCGSFEPLKDKAAADSGMDRVYRRQAAHIRFRGRRPPHRLLPDAQRGS